MAQKERTTREAIVHVLQREARKGKLEMTTKEVVEAVIPLATRLKGKTKEHTIYTTMLAESKKPDGQVEQVKPGLYRLRSPMSGTKAETPEAERQAKPHPKPSTRKRGARKDPVAA